MNMLKTLILIVASISYCVVIGGAVYEHLAIVPVWSAAVPASLTMFQGEHAIAPGRFWIPVHPVTMLLLVTALVLNWRTARRSSIAITIVGYSAVLVVTAIYFVPELMALTQTAYSSTADPDLTRRAGMWETFSLVRLAIMVLMAMILLSGLSRTTGSPFARES